MPGFFAEPGEERGVVLEDGEPFCADRGDAVAPPLGLGDRAGAPGLPAFIGVRAPACDELFGGMDGLSMRACRLQASREMCHE